MTNATSKNLLVRGLNVLGWTAVLVGVFYLADRGIFGPVRKPGWQEAANIKAVPRAAGAIKVPAYLPLPLTWPPARIFYRTNPATGWWVEIAPPAGQTAAVRVWLGTGDGPFPEALGALASCLDPKGTCPDGWHLLSTRIKYPTGGPSAGEPVLMLSNVDSLQAARILEGLRL